MGVCVCVRGWHLSDQQLNHLKVTGEFGSLFGIRCRAKLEQPLLDFVCHAGHALVGGANALSKVDCVACCAQAIHIVPHTGHFCLHLEHSSHDCLDRLRMGGVDQVSPRLSQQPARHQHQHQCMLVALCWLHLVLPRPARARVMQFAYSITPRAPGSSLPPLESLVCSPGSWGVVVSGPTMRDGNGIGVHLRGANKNAQKRATQWLCMRSAVCNNTQ